MPVHFQKLNIIFNSLILQGVPLHLVVCTQRSLLSLALILEYNFYTYWLMCIYRDFYLFRIDLPTMYLSTSIDTYYAIR